MAHFCDKQLHADSIEFDFDFRFKAYEFGAVKSICSAMKTRNNESFQRIQTSNGIIGMTEFFLSLNLKEPSYNAF